MQLIALKPFTYDHRALARGDLFHANMSDAKVLTVLQNARVVRTPTAIPAPPAEIARKIKHSDESAASGIEKLRSDAEALGIKADLRWGAKRLQAEIDKSLA